jgi:hypothetical protein
MQITSKILKLFFSQQRIFKQKKKFEEKSIKIPLITSVASAQIPNINFSSILAKRAFFLLYFPWLFYHHRKKYENDFSELNEFSCLGTRLFRKVELGVLGGWNFFYYHFCY